LAEKRGQRLRRKAVSGVVLVKENGSSPGRRFIRNAAIVVNLVWTFMAVVFGGFFAGYFLDRWLETSPAFTLVLSMLGIVAAAYVVLRETPRLMK
jgi:F0F1-type ATP synthase assembly protein I